MNSIAHIGVKGMKWGVRKLKQEGAEIARKKGQTVEHISEKADLILKDGSFYTSFTKRDILHYRANFADELFFRRNVSKVYQHSYKTQFDLISPKKKRAIDEFIELAKKDKDLLNGLSKSKAKSSMVLTMAKMFGADKKRAEEYRRMAQSKDPADHEKLFKEQMAYMLLDNKTQKKYFDHLSSKGFNSVYDFNDVLAKQATKPLIVFDAQSKLLLTGKDSINSKQSWEAALTLIEMDEKKQ